MKIPSNGNNNNGNKNGDLNTDGKSDGTLSLPAVLGIGFVFTAGLVIGVFYLLVRRKKHRTRNTLARENLGHHVPRDAIRKQRQQGGGGTNTPWGILGRAATRLGLGRSSSLSSARGGGSGGGGFKPESRRLSAISPQAHPMSIAAQMTQQGHPPSSLGYPAMVVEHGTGMVPVSNYVYPSQPLTDSQSLAAPAPIATRATMAGRIIRSRREEQEDGYGALVVYHDLSPAQRGALTLSQGKQASG
ncbi:MAG: hypothetical protein J3R72DRAFT_197105 [Linnemannia gamsii]|nr:MAG: hypothetical protein J3R72DRAFT_197105 [Linnemannia gamsii]